MSVLSKEYNACIYARLSRDDGDKLESDSIINQKALTRDFISKHPEIPGRRLYSGLFHIHSPCMKQVL